jgi:hypothetical protein
VKTTKESDGTDESNPKQPVVCSKCGVMFVPEVPDECQSLIQSLVKVDWEKD